MSTIHFWAKNQGSSLALQHDQKTRNHAMMQNNAMQKQAKRNNHRSLHTMQPPSIKSEIHTNILPKYLHHPLPPTDPSISL